MIVDAKGLACPLPVVKTKNAVDAMDEDGIITVLVDNEIAVQNLSRFAQQREFEVSSKKNGEKEYAVTIQVVKKSQTAQTSTTGDSDEATCYRDCKKGGQVIALSANVMGQGDEKLGKALMKAFVFALTKQDALPETILLYNTGACLSCEGADTLEDLKTLEAEGVNIMTCGTCLDFYGLKEKLSVGIVTNMYDIVETMENAELIIKP